MHIFDTAHSYYFIEKSSPLIPLLRGVFFPKMYQITSLQVTLKSIYIYANT